VILEGDVLSGAHMEGILVKTHATFITGSRLNAGRVLTQTACNLQVAPVTEPLDPGCDTDIFTPFTTTVVISFIDNFIDNATDEDLRNLVLNFFESYNQANLPNHPDRCEPFLTQVLEAKIDDRDFAFNRRLTPGPTNQ
jgi:hypothetical protein